jgi:hypothetical protein
VQHISTVGILYLPVSSAIFIAVTTNFVHSIFLNFQLSKNLYELQASVGKTQDKMGL